MNLGTRLNQSARRFAVRASELPERVDIEQQSGTAGTGSATPGWTAVETDWPCFSKPVKESQGARPTPEMANAPSYSYELTGPAVKVSGSDVTAINVSKEMRVKMKARGAQPEQIFTIVDFALVSGVELKILAKLND